MPFLFQPEIGEMVYSTDTAGNVVPFGTIVRIFPDCSIVQDPSGKRFVGSSFNPDIDKHGQAVPVGSFVELPDEAIAVPSEDISPIKGETVFIHPPAVNAPADSQGKFAPGSKVLAPSFRDEWVDGPSCHRYDDAAGKLWLSEKFLPPLGSQLHSFDKEGAVVSLGRLIGFVPTHPSVGVARLAEPFNGSSYVMCAEFRRSGEDGVILCDCLWAVEPGSKFIPG